MPTHRVSPLKSIYLSMTSNLDIYTLLLILSAIHWYIINKVSKVGDSSWGWHEGSLFDCYYTKE